MRHVVTIVLESPDIPADDPSTPYVVEALLTYVRGVETGAFGNFEHELINTITRCKLSATKTKIE